jgi:hypothetical protein
MNAPGKDFQDRFRLVRTFLRPSYTRFLPPNDVTQGGPEISAQV